MEYSTAAEIADKWGVSIRRVQFLCINGMIPDAVKFGKSWAIPEDAERPKDGRHKLSKKKASDVIQSFRSVFDNEELLAKIVENFPYPIQVSTPDGTLILVNEAFLRAFYIASADKVIGKYNLLHDPIVAKLGLKELIGRAFQGETVYSYDIKVPVQELIDKYGNGELALESKFQNITSFPVYNNNQLSYVVSVFFTSKFYRGKEEIIKGKEYLEIHRLEKFDIDAVANASGLSKTQFIRIFKTETGFTPYSYYLDLKMNLLKEKLLDCNLSISQAFSECGLDYNGHYAKVFKEQVGTTPSEYRKINS